MSHTASKTFTLGHSPDPDDAFMFYAMAKHKIDLRGMEFEHTLQDIQTLNERATRGELDITAVSIHALAYVLDKYALMPSGASMGDGYGPMFVSLANTSPATESPEAAKAWLKDKKIAIPGTMTSAYLAARIFLGDFDYVVIPFDEIFEAVRAGKAEVGLLIHEGQLTYQNEGFQKILDLGEWWKNETGLPLPLGGNVIRKDIPKDEQCVICEILEESIRYGLEHRLAAVTHTLPLARGMETDLTDQFIGMYVNDYTLDYGDKGRAAIRLFLKRAHEAGLIPAPVALEFME
ncbi:MAG: MqnA/MqnD/SBP family protein [Chthoniobacterales bacterium]